MISYFNHQYFNHPTIRQTILEHRGSDTLSKLMTTVKFDRNAPPLYTRKGTDSLLLKNGLADVPKFAMPDYNPIFNKSWKDITDQRCISLRNTHFDCPWIVLWSGGIDSTVVVAAIIKNLSRADLNNITIACTSACIWENPHFYFNHIKPNFKVVNSMETTLQEFEKQNVYIFDGEPADQLFGGLGVSLTTLYQNLDLLHKDIIKHSEVAIDFIANRTDRNFAEWYYHVLVSSAQSAGLDVNTLHELLWWSTFNNGWTTVKFRFILYTYSKWKNVKSAKPYIDKFVHWFDSDDYQQWAMNGRNVSEKIGTNMSDYKLAAKKYIYDVDHNKYYFKFKTKMASGDIFSTLTTASWCCVTDNWDLLNLEDHAEQIVSMLPNHLR